MIFIDKIDNAITLPLVLVIYYYLNNISRETSQFKYIIWTLKPRFN